MTGPFQFRRSLLVRGLQHDFDVEGGSVRVISIFFWDFDAFVF